MGEKHIAWTKSPAKSPLSPGSASLNPLFGWALISFTMAPAVRSRSCSDLSHVCELFSTLTCGVQRLIEVHCANITNIFAVNATKSSLARERHFACQALRDPLLTPSAKPYQKRSLTFGGWLFDLASPASGEPLRLSRSSPSFQRVRSHAVRHSATLLSSISCTCHRSL